jgi:hypothetical protein
LFFISSEASAQTANTVVAPPPNSNLVWVSVPEAQQTVESEIAALTQQLNTLIQNQAPASDIKALKFQLQFYLLVQDFLNQGFYTSEALNMAKSNLAGLDSTNFNQKKLDQVQIWYDEAATLLSH